MRILRCLLATILVALALQLAVTDSASSLTCAGSGGFNGAAAACFQPGSNTLAYVAENSGHKFVVDLACSADSHLCPKNVPTCSAVGLAGEVYNIWEDGALLTWQACLTEHQAAQINGLTPGFVERAYRRLTWPASELVVQPPQGKTLVNFDTNFYTTNTDPTTRTVTLLGQRVTIEATPTQYTWHFGADGGEGADLTTTDPGAPYPDLRVTHRYTRVGTVQPSVDTTYAGRYRVGNGAWQTIPDTLTVPGQAVDLQVVSATPHLVGY